MASVLNSLIFFLCAPANPFKKWPARTGMSFCRSRSGGKLDRDDVQPVEKVLPELPGFHLLEQVLVRGRQDAHIDRKRLLAPDALELLALQHPQELDLGGLGDLADLVQEHRAAVGLFETAGAAPGGAGKGPLLVAEELAFEQRAGIGRAVDHHEGLAHGGGCAGGWPGRPAPCRCRSPPGSARWRPSGPRPRSACR